ncbi:MAG: nucleotide sugar dehydrogenase [Rhodospirillaceae bacterium]
MAHGRKISVIGLGYVGLPVAAAFGRLGQGTVIGLDRDPQRIAELSAGHDRTGEVPDADLAAADITFTTDPAALREADFHIVTVPTPITETNRPDLRPLLSASATVGQHLSEGSIVVYESTVYPGATMEDCVPVLEAESGLRCGPDFTVGYSPERINPGDKEHRFETIVKVVAGQDAPTLEVVAMVYEAVVQAGVHRAATIAVAEAAKVIENTQRDINIALMNELAVIFSKLGIDTGDVLAAARTKWNFLPFSPGLVGGHCIGVDPFYLTHRAEQAGYIPQVILSGRRVNDGMGAFVARKCMKKLLKAGLTHRAKIGLLGLSFKENVPDVRNTRSVDILAELESFGAEVLVHDPLADPKDALEEYGVTLCSAEALTELDAVILAVAHADYLKDGGWPLLSGMLRQEPTGGPIGVVMDVKGRLSRDAVPASVTLWRL